ncbi:MAG: cation diffusion facilitator family transporter [Bacteroidia bacterium]
MSVQSAIKTSIFSLLLNFFMAAGKWVVGYFGHSYALMADAIESSTDIFSSVIVYMGLKIAAKPADENHPYGHGKAEPIATFLVCAFLVFSAILIAVQSITHIRTPHKIPEAYTLYFLLGIVISKEIAYRLVSRKGKETNSTVLEADAWHHRSDAITSLAAMIGISIALFGGDGYETADDWAALFTSAIILYNAYLIFRPALGEMMDEHQYDEMVTQIRSISHEVPGVVDTEKCFIRKAGLTFYVDLHLVVDGNITVREGHSIAHNLKDTIRSKMPEIADIIVHVEPFKENP